MCVGSTSRSRLFPSTKNPLLDHATKSRASKLVGNGHSNSFRLKSIRRIQPFATIVADHIFPRPDGISSSNAFPWRSKISILINDHNVLGNGPVN